VAKNLTEVRSRGRHAQSAELAEADAMADTVAHEPPLIMIEMGAAIDGELAAANDAPLPSFGDAVLPSIVQEEVQHEQG
jgi:hypothetical protein